MKPSARFARIAALCSMLVAAAGCGGDGNNTSVSISGNITGLTEGGLVLSNGISNVALGANATAFTFPSRVLIGSPYSIRPSVLPANLLCTVTNGSGVAGTDSIDQVQVSCVPRHTLGGTITGLNTAGLILANGSDTVELPAGAQSYVFAVKVGEGFSYGVTVLQQPTPQRCDIVANGSGLMGVADINNVQVACQ
ncbi:MAG: hypothetical protein V4695_13520 [Pseudomonadota bacterium]